VSDLDLILKILREEVQSGMQGITLHSQQGLQLTKKVREQEKDPETGFIKIVDKTILTPDAEAQGYGIRGDKIVKTGDSETANRIKGQHNREEDTAYDKSQKELGMIGMRNGQDGSRVSQEALAKEKSKRRSEINDAKSKF
jgi:hypothetical protein